MHLNGKEWNFSGEHFWAASMSFQGSGSSRSGSAQHLRRLKPDRPVRISEHEVLAKTLRYSARCNPVGDPSPIASRRNDAGRAGPLATSASITLPGTKSAPFKANGVLRT
jgi:hypothetical protein